MSKIELVETIQEVLKDTPDQGLDKMETSLERLFSFVQTVAPKYEAQAEKARVLLIACIQSERHRRQNP